jgi:hypothetical protein
MTAFATEVTENTEENLEQFTGIFRIIRIKSQNIVDNIEY